MSKYITKISAQAIIASARIELKTTDPEAYKAFLIGLFVGLRKAEIDLLEWRMLDFSTNVIRLEETEWLSPKTYDSAAELPVDAEVLAELHRDSLRTLRQPLFAGQHQQSLRREQSKQQQSDLRRAAKIILSPVPTLDTVSPRDTLAW